MYMHWCIHGEAPYGHIHVNRSQKGKWVHMPHIGIDARDTLNLDFSMQQRRLFTDL